MRRNARPKCPDRTVDDRVIFGECLAKAEGENQFTVREVGDDLADAPLAGFWRTIGVRGREWIDKKVQSLGGCGDNWNGVLTAEERERTGSVPWSEVIMARFLMSGLWPSLQEPKDRRFRCSR